MNQRSKLRYAHMREINRPQTQHFPQRAIQRLQTELMPQKRIFFLQPAGILIRFAGQQSRLPEQQGLQLEQIIPVLAQTRHRQRTRQQFKSLPVDVETEIARQANIKRFFPEPLVLLQHAGYESRFLFQPFYQQRVFPRRYDNVGHFAEVIGTCHALRLLLPLPEFLRNRFGIAQLALWNGLAVRAVNRAIRFLDNMQYHIVISAVLVVSVPVPVRGTHVDFYIPGPKRIAYPDFRVEKIGSAVRVEAAGIDYFHRPAIRRGLRKSQKTLLLPNIMQELLHVSEKQFSATKKNIRIQTAKKAFQKTGNFRYFCPGNLC